VADELSQTIWEAPVQHCRRTGDSTVLPVEWGTGASGSRTRQPDCHESRREFTASGGELINLQQLIDVRLTFYPRDVWVFLMLVGG
jgi:hypothetical protein